jgi:hypothetical protein
MLYVPDVQKAAYSVVLCLSNHCVEGAPFQGPTRAVQPRTGHVVGLLIT